MQVRDAAKAKEKPRKRSTGDQEDTEKPAAKKPRAKAKTAPKATAAKSKAKPTGEHGDDDEVSNGQVETDAKAEDKVAPPQENTEVPSETPGKDEEKPPTKPSIDLDALWLEKDRIYDIIFHEINLKNICV